MQSYCCWWSFDERLVGWLLPWCIMNWTRIKRTSSWLYPTRTSEAYIPACVAEIHIYIYGEIPMHHEKYKLSDLSCLSISLFFFFFFLAINVVAFTVVSICWRVSAGEERVSQVEVHHELFFFLNVKSDFLFLFPFFFWLNSLDGRGSLLLLCTGENFVMKSSV